MTTALGRATGVVFRLIVVDAEVAFAVYLSTSTAVRPGYSVDILMKAGHSSGDLGMERWENGVFGRPTGY